MNYPSIRLEGAILTADLLDAIAREDKHSQKPADFGLDPSSKVKDEIASTWASAKALWTGYQAKIANLREGQTGVSETRNLFALPLLALLGYQPEKAEAETLNGKSYAISHRDISRDGFPLHIMGWHDSLEKKRTTGGPRISAHALVQEYLNLTEHLYGIITNGRQLRLLRDSSRLIKLSFLEFDLNRIFEEDLYADFAILFRLIHATRMPANRAHASGSVIEKYHQESVDSGSRIRDGLAAAVAFSMQTVANGLLTHPANASLVEQLKREPARANELHQNLLRWVYRTLFVLVIEERVLHHAPAATLRQRQLYRDYYSLQRLRRLADRPQLADRRAHDLWRAMHQTLRLYEDGGKGLPLGIAPLGSFLFREEGLQQLFQYQLDNRSLLQALNRLSTFTHPDTNVRMRVNYGALDVEEFGSVYESLLELRPRIIPEGEKLSFSYAQLAGNERKTTGSYYTPDSLVQCLLDSALDPVVDERLAGKVGKEAEKALLSIKVCDPAVGSGHFLIGAAHRLAQRLADIRAGEEALSPDVQRHALRDVVSQCLYGVDINPLSVELCKVSLWMLAMEPGKPLGFLDHHVRCGNSLLGTTPELVGEGIPDDAFSAIEGDDKKACAELKKQNKVERKGLGVLFAKEEASSQENLRKAASAIDEIGDDNTEGIRRKEAAFNNAQLNYDFQKARDLANLWCAAFVIKKYFPGGANASPSGEPLTINNSALTLTETLPTATQIVFLAGTDETRKPEPRIRRLSASPSQLLAPWGISTQHLRNFVEGAPLPDGLVAESKRLADQYQFFHFHLMFPEVFAQGGFDVSLGNPPWERVKLQEKEWFAQRRPEIALAPNAAARKRLIAALRSDDPTLETAFREASRQAEGESHFMSSSGAYPLCGRGDINLYAVFAERTRNLINHTGRLGCLLPTGIATDDTTKFYFQDIIAKNSLVSVFGFENEEFIFLGVHHAFKFCLLTVAGLGRQTKSFKFVFYARQLSELTNPSRCFTLNAEDMRLLKPNTRTCPVFRSSTDAELTKHIYRRVPIVSDENTQRNPWGLEFLSTFHMSATAEHFRTRSQLQDLGFRTSSKYWVKPNTEPYVPLYESKLFHQFDHRYSQFSAAVNIDEIETEPLSVESKQKPDSTIIPRYWLPKSMVEEKFGRNDTQLRWLIAYRKITPSTNTRTVIATVFPPDGLGDSINSVRGIDAKSAAYLTSLFNSFCFDYVCRLMLGGTNLSFWIFKQLPLLSPEQFDQSFNWRNGADHFRSWLLPRVLELTYTAWDLEAFAQDCGWSGPPFRWDEERRFLLRCELDAAFFHLYLGSETEWRQQPAALTQAFPTPRAAVAYILDTFPIVKRKDEAKFNGDYRTKRVILEIYDALTESMQTGKPYETRLNPPAASQAVAHPWSWDGKPLELPTTLRVPLPESWQYVVTVMVELIWQAGGSLPWRVLRSATDLLSDRKRLARLAELHVGQVALDWLALNGDSFDATHRWDQLSGLCHMGKLRVVRRDGELVVELLSTEGHLLFPHVRSDARLALTVARPLPAEPQTQEALQDERRVAELIPA